MGDAEISSVRTLLQRRLVELVESGRTQAVESLLLEHSELRANVELLVDCIYAEFCLREVRGQEPQFVEYLRRFPEHADRLRSRFEMHVRTHPLDQPRKMASESIHTKFTSRPEPQGSSSAPRGSTHASASVDLVPGSTLGPYEIVAKLGQGGMGAVYKARHQHLDKIVAVKVLPLHLIHEADAVARFKREMKAIGQFEHPNIVRAMDAGEVEGSLYLAMEYVEGSDLRDLVEQHGPMAVEPACKALLQAAHAMAAAHRAGLVHRDLKPANLLLAKTGQIKVLDLGLARLALDQQVTADLTLAGQAFGTPDYMAPEQWDDTHLVDRRADLYSLGCTLFFLLVGKAPYGTKKYNSIMAKMKGHVVDPIPDLRAACPIELPDALVRLYERLLAKAPKDRLQTADELVEALIPFAGEPISAEVTLNEVTVGTKVEPAVPRRMALRWWMAGSGILLFVILLIGALRFKAPPQPWLPAKLQEFGFKASKDSQRCQVHDRMFETQLVRTIAGKDVLFQLVPEFEIPKKDRTIRTFYIMETPVSNAMFNVFATENPSFEMVNREEAQRTWKTGDDQPVVNVHPLEAQQFAQWLVPDYASLPTSAEWDLASGYYDFVDLLKDKVQSRLQIDVVLVGQNQYTAAKFKVGAGPGIGEFQAVGKRSATKNRSPYGCLYPSRTGNVLFEFGEITATVRDVKQGVEDLREWTSDIRKVNLPELLSTAQSQLRMLIKHSEDFRWIIPEGDEAEGLCLTVEQLDEMCGVLYLNTSQGGVGFNRNIGFRVIALTKPPSKPGQL